MTWSIVLAAVGILGIYLAGKKNLYGWAIGLGAQVLWVVYALVTDQYGFILSAVAYGTVYGRNWYLWRKELRGIKQEQKENEEERDPSLVARVHLTADVHMETEPTIDTPSAWEPGYDYLVIRDVVSDGHNFYGNESDKSLIEVGEFGVYEFDPDGLLVESVADELRSISGVPSEIDGEN